MSNGRIFMLWPDGRIEEVDDDGDTYDYPNEPGLYDDLVVAGYPTFRDDSTRLGTAGSFDAIIDLRVEAGRVIVHTNKIPPHEHDMGPAGDLFLSWFRQNADS